MENIENQEMEKKDGTGMTEEKVAEKKDAQKEQNYIAAIVLLAGLFVGSLFIDALQMINGSGFSEKIVKNASVLESGGKTWVAYDEPIIHVDVISDSSCEKCSPDQALVFLKRAMPTLIARPVEYNTEEGKSMMAKSGAISLPAFIFSGEVVQSDIFAQAETLFAKQDDNHYVLDTAQIGMPAGKYLSLPEILDSNAQVGSKDAKVRIVEYSDFQCPYCKLMYSSVKQMISQYGDQILFSYKHLPLSFHPQANNAALASECANEQGKFWQYHDNLFVKQDEWSKTEGVQKFKDYAVRMGLKAQQFNECLDSKKYQDKVDTDSAEARKFGINGTPGMFVNDQFIGGAVSFDELKNVIDGELAK